MFNLTNQIIYLKSDDELSKDIKAVIKEFAQDTNKFFTKIGFDTEQSPLDSKELTNGNAHYGYSFHYFTQQNNLLDKDYSKQDVDNWLDVANNTYKDKLWNTHKANLKSGKPSAFKEAILQPIEHYLKEITNLDPLTLNGNVASNLAYVTNCLLVRLWRKRSIILPISSKLDLFRCSTEVFKIKANNRGKKGPLFKADDTRLLSLNSEFPIVAFGHHQCTPIESEVLGYSKTSCSTTGPLLMLYTSQCYAESNCDYQDFKDVHIQHTLLFGKPFLLIDKKQVTRDKHQLLSIKKPFTAFNSGYNSLKTIINEKFEIWKSREVGAIAKTWSHELKNEVAKSLHSVEDINKILVSKDENALFIYCLNLPIQIDKLDDLTIFLPDKVSIDLSQWIEYYSTWKSSSPTSDHGKGGALNLIVKYLIYIKLWITTFHESATKFAISFPTVFKQLDRETFVIRNTVNKETATTEWPRTLAELAGKSNSTSCVQLRLFLNETENFYRLNPKHVIPNLSLLHSNELTSHWHKKENGIRIGISTTISPKNVITKRAFPIVMETAYAIESYGEYLQEQLFNKHSITEIGLFFDTEITGKGSNTTSRNLIKFGCAHYKDIENKIIEINYNQHKKNLDKDTIELIKSCYKNKFIPFGYTPIIWYQNAQLDFEYYALTPDEGYFPQIFTTGKIKVKSDPSKLKTSTEMVFLGTIRGHIVALEQGLRHIHIRWLDSERYNLKADSITEHGFTKLLISSDKTKKTEWLQNAHISVIKLLDREKVFQDQREDITPSKKYRYKEEKNTPYITPLFLNNSGLVFGENVWGGRWTILLHICNQVLIKTLKDEYKFKRDSLVRYVPVSKDNKIGYQDKSYSSLRLHQDHPLVIAGKIRPINVDRINGEYTEIRLISIVTPHGSRNTWITHRVGIMPLHHISKGVGHGNVEVTARYVIDTEEDADKYYEDYKKSMIPKSSNEKVKKAFSENPQETAYLYGFTSIPLNISVDEEKEPAWTGLDIIETVNIDQITFTDTHICPFSMACPDEITQENGGVHKCGICRAKVVHIDNLRAIENIQIKLTLDEYTKTQKVKKINSNSNPDLAEIEKLTMEISTLQNEVIGWELASNALEAIRKTLIDMHGKDINLNADNIRAKGFFCPAPTMLNSKIIRQTKREAIHEIALRHMLAHEDFPALTSDALQPMAKTMGNQLITKLAQYQPQTATQLFKDFALENNKNEVISSTVNLMRTMVAAKLISVNEIVDQLAPTILINNSPVKSKFKRNLEEIMNKQKGLSYEKT